jgi:radical SAM protein with 4Fe4S-binding SPASM domain
MRVRSSIKTLAGPLRIALYDLRQGSCVPIDNTDYQVLATLSQGRDPITTTKKAERANVVRKLAEMRAKQWLEPGSPQLHDLALKAPPKAPVNQLEHVWIELTNTCNLECDHCYAESGPTVSRVGELTDAQWDDALRAMLEQPINTLTFIGGEPLVRINLLVKLARLARLIQPTLVIRVFSNLAISAAVEKLVEFAKTLDINVGTSLYGTTAMAHDKMTRREGSWAKTTDAIKKLREIDVPIFVGYFCHEGESRLLAESFLHSIEVINYKIQEPSNVGRGAVINWKIKKKGNVLPLYMAFDTKRFFLGFQGHNCFQDHFSIRPDGAINPCIMARDVRLGNIKETPLRRVQESADFVEFASMGKDEIVGCADCEFRYSCFDCRPDAKGATTNWKAKPDCGYDPAVALSPI